MANEKSKLHNVEIKNREYIVLTGVEKVKNINSNQFVGKVAGYGITIQGANLELVKLDLDNGLVEISGQINSLKYTGATSGGGILKRMFK